MRCRLHVVISIINHLFSNVVDRILSLLQTLGAIVYRRKSSQCTDINVRNWHFCYFLMNFGNIYRVSNLYNRFTFLVNKRIQPGLPSVKHSHTDTTSRLLLLFFFASFNRRKIFRLILCCESPDTWVGVEGGRRDGSRIMWKQKIKYIWIWKLCRHKCMHMRVFL